MGANDSKLFKQGEPISNYQIIQKIPQQSITYLSHKTTGKSYLLKEFAYNDKKQFNTNSQKFKVRKSLSCEHLTRLQRVQQKFEDQLCSTFFKIFTMWEYPLNNLSQQINRRAIDKKYFEEKQIWSILASTIIGMNCLQSANIKHECLSTKTILLDEKTSSVKIADPLICATQTNFDLINANRRLKTIYLSPQQTQSLKNQRPIPNRNPYKSDVFTMGMILLQCGLMERVDDAYRQECQEISYQTIEKKLDAFQKRYSQDLRLIIQLMLNRDAKERPCWNQLNQYVLKTKEGVQESNDIKKATSTNQQTGMQFYKNNNAQNGSSIQPYKFRPLGATSSNVMPTSGILNQNNNANNTVTVINKQPSVLLGGTGASGFSGFTQTAFKPVNYNHNFTPFYNVQSDNPQKQTTSYNSFGTFGKINNNNNNNNSNSNFSTSNYITSQPIYTASILPAYDGKTTNNMYRTNQQHVSQSAPKKLFQFQTNLIKNPQPYTINTYQNFVPSSVTQTLKQNKLQYNTKEYFKSYADSSNKVGQYYQSTYTSSIPAYVKPVQNQFKPLNRVESNLMNKSPENDVKNIPNNYSTTSPLISNYIKDATSITYQKNMYSSHLDSNYQKPSYQNIDAKTSTGNQFWKQFSNVQPWKQPINSQARKQPTIEPWKQQQVNNQPWKQQVNNEPWKQAISFQTNPQQNFNYYASNNNKVNNQIHTNANKQPNYSTFNQYQLTKTQNNYYASSVPNPYQQFSNISPVQQNPAVIQKIQQQKSLQNLEYVVQHFKQGSRYEGTKLNDMRHGQGKFFYQDGGMYDGNWKFNKMDGYGKLFYQSEKIAYQGNWHDDQFQGFGKLYNQQSDPLNDPFQYENFDFIEQYWEFYEGNFVQDEKDGQGKLVFSNGQSFIGTFSKDMVEGPGKFNRSNGQIISGIWNQNQLIQEN